MTSMQQFMLDWLKEYHPEAKPCGKKTTLEDCFERINLNKDMGKIGRADWGWCLYWNDEIGSTHLLSEKKLREELTGYKYLSL